MILFTAKGSLYQKFISRYQAEVISIRSATDEELLNMFAKATVIIHNSADLISQTIEEAVDNNFLLTKKAIDLVYKNQLKTKFILISSMSILDDENTFKDINKMSNYAFSKYMAEIYCLKHSFENKISIRFSTLFYSDQKKDGLSKLIFDAVTDNQIKLINGGEDSRDFIPIDIAVQYLHEVCNLDKFLKPTLNIASGKAIKFKDIATLIKKRIPSLAIDNVNITSNTKVLNQFCGEDLRAIAKINYSLENYIDEFLDFLKNENTHLQ